jgi:hypothetical protein
MSDDHAPGRPDGPPPTEPRNSWPSRRRVLTALGVIGSLCVLLGIILAVTGGGHRAAPVATASHAAAESAVTPVSPAVSSSSASHAAAEPAVTPLSSAASSSSSASSSSIKGSGAAPSLAAVPHTVATFSGSGVETTPTFTTTATWKLAYSFNCSHFGGPARAEVIEKGGSQSGRVLLNESTLRAEGSTRVHGDPGLHYLRINSPCSWIVKVVDQP